MALLYKLWSFLFLSIIVVFEFHELSCNTSVIKQAAKIINKSGNMLHYQHVLPEDSIAYIHIIGASCPQAQITSWSPGTYGNTKEARELDEQKPLPIWIRIGFDREVTQSFIDDFFVALRLVHRVFRNINPVRHRKFKNEFIIRVGAYYKPIEVRAFIERANILMYKKMLKESSETVRNYI